MSTETSDQNSSFLSLLAEIRCLIWQYLLVLPRPITALWHKRSPPSESKVKVNSKRASRKFRTRRKQTVLAPIFACRKFYAEAIPIYYAENHFSLRGLYHKRQSLAPDDNIPPLWIALPTFAEAIGSINARLIRNITISIRLERKYNICGRADEQRYYGTAPKYVILLPIRSTNTQKLNRDISDIRAMFSPS